MTALTEAPAEERLARIEALLAEVREELQSRAVARERWSEFADDLAPLAGEAVSLLTRHLDADARDFPAAASLAHSLVRDADTLAAGIDALPTLIGFTEEVGPLGTAAMQSVNRRLQQLDDRGYFAFIRQTAAIVDNVVTSFSEEDVKLLGENIVLILTTVKEMTQPEIMTLLGRAARSLQDGDSVTAPETPSYLALLRQLRDPMVRRGLARVLATLRAVGAESPPADRR